MAADEREGKRRMAAVRLTVARSPAARKMSPEPDIERTEQPDMLDHDQGGYAQYHCGRERRMRQDVVQDDSVTGDEHGDSRRQHRRTRQRAAMSAHGTVASTNSRPRVPTGPLLTTFKPASLSMELR